MEMVEGLSQLKIAPNRIEFEEIMEEDRISVLPDCLLAEILSRLPTTKCAIRTGTLSKRWKHVWTLVHTLIFLVTDFDDSSDFVSFVDKTLTQCRQLKLKQFVVCTDYDIRLESQFNHWIRYALSCNVETLIFRLWSNWDSDSDLDSDSDSDSDSQSEFQLDQSVYISSCFTHLTLAGCVFNPTRAISWKNLRSLVLCRMKLDEELIENILSGTPLLETLVLDDCYGYKQLNITSKNVKNLVLDGYKDPEGGPIDTIEINAPDILSLAIKGYLKLWKLLLLNVSSLVVTNLNYKRYGYYETTIEEAEEEMLEGLIQNLHHVKEFTIGVSCFEVLFRLNFKGFIFPSNTKVKIPDVTSPSYSDDDSLSDCD